jgi:7-cyano-7-deazaguanine tRNA-ribosyltransferase
MLDFPGVIVTDSGTFQSYVYGDVEVGVSEIVEFQRDIGVDIGTMLDVFGRPDMSREELEKCVDETALRAKQSLESAGVTLLLNGPVQGGLYEDLRAKAGNLMGAAEGEFRGFTIHPVGGIVPLMEKPLNSPSAAPIRLPALALRSSYRPPWTGPFRRSES